MSIKLVAIDIDGTLLNEKREVTKEVKEAIAAAVAKGVSIVLCTGRPLPGVQEQLNELNLFKIMITLLLITGHSYNKRNQVKSSPVTD